MKKLLAMILCLAMVLSLTACSTTGPKDTASDKTDETTDPAAGTSDNTDGTEEKKTFVMGTSADYPPYEFIIINDKGEQEYVGIDVSLAQQIAEDMGAELKIVNMSFENLMISLGKGEVDAVIAALEEDEERAQVADFSDAYYTDQPPMILVKKDNADQYSTLEDFSGKKVGAQMSTTKADIVNEQMTGANLVALSSVNDLVNELVYDKCDAIVLDGAVALQYAESNSDLIVADVSLGEAAPYRVTVQKGDPKGLLESINKTIASVIESGEMDEYIQTAEELSSQALES